MNNGLQWLKAKGCLDGKAESVIKRLVGGNRRFLIVGNTKSGKNTLAEAVYSYMCERGKNPTLLPTVEGKDFSAVRSNKYWKVAANILNQDIPAVMPMGYAKAQGFHYYIPELPQMGKYFDVILDIRKLAGDKRVLCQIFIARGKRLRCVYRHPSFATNSDTHSVAA